MDPLVERLIEKAKADEAVLAVILFGSRARGEELPGSDIDLCLVLAPAKDTKIDQMTARMRHTCHMAAESSTSASSSNFPCIFVGAS